MSTDPRLSDAALTPSLDSSLREPPADCNQPDYEREMIDSAIEFAIFTFFEDRTIASWSVGAERIFGYHEDEILGKPFDLLFTPEDRAAGIPAQEMGIAAEEGRASDERWHVRKNGNRFYASGAVSPVKGATPRRFVKIAMDHTRRKLMEDELKESDRRKNEFIATLAEELRNPLAPIRTGIELLSRSDTASETREKVLGIMEGQMNTMVHLVDDLLEISRITQGKVQLKLEWINLGEVVRDAVAACQNTGEQWPQKVEIRMPGEPVWIQGDAVRMEQCVVNLVLNAFKFTPSDGRIAVSLSVDEEVVGIVVEDTGRGLRPEELISIFEIFAQVSDSPIGLGIGLAVVKSVIGLHGGQITADSPGPGLGSKFTIRMPKGKYHPKDEAVVTPPTGKSNLRGMRVLIVDDNIDAADLLETALATIGFNVRTAHSGLAGVAESLDFQPHICLCDIGLPEIDGYEVARRVLERSPDIVFIAISGWGGEADRRRSKDAGFAHHMVKPVKLDELWPLLVLE